MVTRMKYIARTLTVGFLIGISVFVVKADQTAVAQPQGTKLLFEVVADGVQIYVCEPKGSGFDWAFKAPEANLFDEHGRQIGTHFAGPTWKMEDGSAVVCEGNSESRCANTRRNSMAAASRKEP
jgi:hypothetical protein